MKREDVVFVNAVRTPVGRLGGALADIRPDDLASFVIRQGVRNAGIEPSVVEEVYMGCANRAGEDNRNVARKATLLAGFPHQIGAVTLNRLCDPHFSYRERKLSAHDKAEVLLLNKIGDACVG